MTTMAAPAWLPSTIPAGADWDNFIRRAYEIFERDFKQSCPRHVGKLVWFDKRRLDPDDKYGFEEGFWHLTTKEQSYYDQVARTHKKERVHDPRRSERLPWCRPVIENTDDGEVLLWRYREQHGEIRTYVWLQKHDYVAILRPWPTKRFQTVWMLVTAFYVDYRNTRSNLELKFKNRVK